MSMLHSYFRQKVVLRHQTHELIEQHTHSLRQKERNLHFFGGQRFALYICICICICICQSFTYYTLVNLIIMTAILQITNLEACKIQKQSYNMLYD